MRTKWFCNCDNCKYQRRLDKYRKKQTGKKLKRYQVLMVI
jgi:hypothetical protein